MLANIFSDIVSHFYEDPEDGVLLGKIDERYELMDLSTKRREKATLRQRARVLEINRRNQM